MCLAIHHRLRSRHKIYDLPSGNFKSASLFSPPVSYPLFLPGFFYFMTFFCFLVGMIKVRHCGRTAGEISFQIPLSVRWFDESLAGIEWQWRDFWVLIVAWQTNGLECGRALFLGVKLRTAGGFFQTSVLARGEAGLCMWLQQRIVTSCYKTLHAFIHPLVERTRFFLVFFEELPFHHACKTFWKISTAALFLNTFLQGLCN